MYLTISSVLTTVFLCSILILFLCGLFKNNSFAAKVGPGCMIGLLLAVLIRMLVPFEFFYTYSVYIEDVLSPILQFFIYPIYEGKVVITVWHMLIVISIIGSMLLFGRELIVYKKLCRWAKLMKEVSVSTLCKEHDMMIDNLSDVHRIKIVLSSEVKTPYLIGLRRPCILLPNMQYTNREMYYVLKHELLHIQKKDILWKVLIDLICTIFWWNPVFWYLKNELFQMIEMRNDKKLISEMNDEQQIEYMECLKNMVEQTSRKEISFSLSFSKSNFRQLKRRMLLIAKDSKVRRSFQVIVVLIGLISIVMTSLVIIEPKRLIKEESAGTPMTSENTFLIKNGETYDVYVDGVYLFNTDDLRPFQGVNIYNSIEEAQEND